MKKALFLAICLFPIFFLPLQIFAQEENVETPVQPTATPTFIEEDSVNFKIAYEKYLVSLNLYGKAHEDYVTSKSQYLRTGTEKSKTLALDDAINAEQSRSDVVISYLNMIYAKLTDTKGVSDDIISKIKIRIDDEILWYENSKLQISTAVDFRNFNNQSTKNSERISTTTNSLVYTILVNIAHARVANYDQRSQMIIRGMESKLEEIKNESRQEYVLEQSELTILQRWMDEVKISKLQAENKKDEINKLIVSDQITGSGVYNRSISELENASKYLREALSKILEIIYEIKNES